MQQVDVLVAGLGPGGCAAALAARAAGLSTLALEARGPEATRAQLILLRPGAQAALQRLGLPDVTEGRRTTTIRHVENRLRAALMAAQAEGRTAAAPAPFELHWHTSVSGLDVGPDHVLVTLRDATTGSERQVRARHVIDAAGGRLEALGRPARERAGPTHIVATAEYSAPPWFDGIVGVHDAQTHELCMLFPTWGRKGVIVYLDARPGPGTDGATHVQRFEALARSLDLGPPQYPVMAVDVFQRALSRPTDDRVLPIGDSVGNVDVLWGAGASSAIEDGAEAAIAIAAAQRAATPAAEQARTREACARIFARHRAIVRRGRIVLAVRPVLERAWPKATLPAVQREAVGPPPLLWPAVRLAFGRRPQPR
ncbi:MAG: FAD-dependent monooxygenase [Rubrivivax sp.]|nr:FAD-dependent monooxygenase [Rubrivivax sp.]